MTQEAYLCICLCIRIATMITVAIPIASIGLPFTLLKTRERLSERWSKLSQEA